MIVTGLYKCDTINKLYKLELLLTMDKCTSSIENLPVWGNARAVLFCSKYYPPVECHRTLRALAILVSLTFRVGFENIGYFRLFGRMLDSRSFQNHVDYFAFRNETILT